ncbi:hypothetical protein JX265_009448 [Neoarthrinium moseri]|uniref:Uncharacterized protein n=1 Tax=Neoarthrinium moseri TaxID=1658444 RepID=A0A9P9WFJ5_9PEZI|nr:hypothetical protein JX265_009448 [Neoarthrinium moseri]
MTPNVHGQVFICRHLQAGERKGPGDSGPTILHALKIYGAESTYEGKVSSYRKANSWEVGLERTRALAFTCASLFLGLRGFEEAVRVHAGILPFKAQLLQFRVFHLQSVRVSVTRLLRASSGRLNLMMKNAGVIAPLGVQRRRARVPYGRVLPGTLPPLQPPWAILALRQHARVALMSRRRLQ